MSSTSSIKEQYLDCFGFLQHITPGKVGRDGMYTRHLEAGLPWALDNSMFTGRFCFETWANKIEAFAPYLDTCVFVVIPDVIGNAKKTLEQFGQYADLVRPFGYPLAFVSQDGLTPQDTPWDRFEVLFVGGTDEHKLGREAGILIAEGIKRDKWVHIGRVNSPSRMRRFWRADSWDGTQLSFQPDNYTPRIAAAVREIRALKQVRGF
jgi:hypothetical protein